ncbi:MAG TPA: LysR family transcriptional regulator [Paracoccaceae bacterium]|nr:LysR family transcriptional regulator [Paracoccaceae bacterium]
MDRFEDLRAFVQTVESGNLTRAAETLQVATSAVSRRIKDLEGRLGTQLLQRTTRQMRLTAAGESFHARAVAILQALEEAETEAGCQSRTLTGPLRVAAPLSFGQSHLSPILVEFAHAHPGLELDVDFSDRVVDLVAEGHDLAVRIGNLRDSSLIARKLVDVHLAVAAAPDFWARHGMPATPDDLGALSALCYTGSERVDSWRYTSPDGATGAVQMKACMRSTNGSFLRDAAVAGLGVVMLPSFIIHDEVAAGRLVPTLTDHRWPTVAIHVVYPQTRHLSARARAFIELLRARLGARPDWEKFLEPRPVAADGARPGGR